MRSVVVGIALLLFSHSSTLRADDLPHLDTAVVVLRYPSNLPLGYDNSRAVFDKSLEILRSSNFNSFNPLWKWDAAKTHSEYARAVSGNHVLITFTKPETIKTVGGYVNAIELVIGLNGSQYASSVHTIEGNGTVVGHAKYSGELSIEILQLIQQIASTS